METWTISSHLMPKRSGAKLGHSDPKRFTFHLFFVDPVDLFFVGFGRISWQFDSWRSIFALRFPLCFLDQVSKSDVRTINAWKKFPASFWHFRTFEDIQTWFDNSCGCKTRCHPFSTAQSLCLQTKFENQIDCVRGVGISFGYLQIPPI